MPTLYSLTYDLLDNQEQLGNFLKSIRGLEKKVKAAEPYVIQAIEQLQRSLSSVEEADHVKVRESLVSIVEDEMFKKGASVIEFAKDVTLDKSLKVINTKQLEFFQEEPKGIQDTLEYLRRYTIDSIKEVPIPNSSNRDGVTETKKVRIIEAVLNPNKIKEARLTFSDILDSSVWIEEVEHIIAMDEAKDFFPKNDLLILEGRVILRYKNRVFDITELVRQKAKESYKKLLKFEGRFLHERRMGK